MKIEKEKVKKMEAPQKGIGKKKKIKKGKI
jgi:hypothetical protein